jgi:hypothetical protein
MDARLIDAGLLVGSLGFWFAAYGLALLATRPAGVRPAPATQDLGPESPAVASLLVNGWDLTEDAVESTLLDLGARRYLEFRQPSNDPMQTTIHVRETSPVGLTAYERMVFDRVAWLAKGGVVPLTALTFRDDRQAASWWKRLRADIIADARSKGLSQRRFGPTVISILVTLAGVAALGTTAAAFRYTHRTNDDDWVGVTLAVAFFTFFGLSAFASRSVGERDTPAGREAASRWLGVRDWLRGHEAFADLPPSAVAVWDRYLAYGAAVGTTRLSSAVIDIGMADRKRLWSCFGGTWHKVRVSYPRFGLRYGKKAHVPIIRGLICGVIGYFLIAKLSGVVDSVKTDAGLPDAVNQGADLFTRVAILVGVVLFVYGLYTLVRGIIDMATPATITGEVLWQQVWQSNPGGENSPPRPWLHYLAVDDGKADRTVAWGLPSELSSRCEAGDTVTIKVRRWTRRVLTITVDHQGSGRRLDLPDASSEQVETLIADAMGIPRPRSSTRTATAAPAVAVAALLTPDEVSRVVGAPTRAKQSVATPMMPMQLVEFETTQGQQVLLMTIASGLPATLALRARKRGTPLPGVGDEAYGGNDWAVAKCGDWVVGLQLRGASRSVDPSGVHWLLSTAVGRLTAAATG